MSTRHSDNDGSDIFWPGYVDAVTNLVLNLLFLLTIMTVAVFMFALELGRASRAEADKPPAIYSPQETKEISKTTPADSAKENLALKREIERLNAKLAQLAAQKTTPAIPGQPGQPGRLEEVGLAGRLKQPGQLGRLEQPGLPGKLEQPQQSGRLEQPGQAGRLKQPAQAGRIEQPAQSGRLEQPWQSGQLEQPGQSGRLEQPGLLDGTVKTVDVTSNAAKPLTGLDQAVANDDVVIIRFKDDAVAFTPEERARLLETLKPIVARGKASIYVNVPAGFSEAKRMGYYRVMAVRNLLIEMKMPQANISQLVDDKGIKNANASLVRVK